MNVKFKKWIPAETVTVDGDILIKDGTGKYEEKNGILIHWGITFEECDKGIGQKTIAIIKDEEGFFHEIAPCNIKEHKISNNKYKKYPFEIL